MIHIDDLNQEENYILNNLTFYPEDKEVKTNYNFINPDDKIMAISIYDAWRGCMLGGDVFCHTYENMFRKIFGCEVKNLFNIPQPVFGSKMKEYVEMCDKIV